MAEHEPQSWAQLLHISLASHFPSPQEAGHSPQSAGQLVQSSPASHFWLPHITTTPQSPHWREVTSLTQSVSHSTWQQYASWAQTQAVTAGSSHPVPAWGSQQGPVTQGPQSFSQFTQVSVGSHTASPHVAGAPHRPQPNCSTSWTHRPSHAVWQQKPSLAHTQASTALSSHPGIS